MTQTQYASMSLPDRRPIGPLVFGASAPLALIALVVMGYFSLTMPIQVGRASTRVWVWTNTTELLSHARLTASAGDLVSARDHHVLKSGAGFPSILVVDGKTATSAEKLHANAAVDRQRGRDRVEALVTRDRVTRPKVVFRGAGPIESVVQTGSPGLRRLTLGSISHQVVGSVLIRPAVPTVVVRRWPAAGRVVALTFDDGPHPTQTQQVLAVLQTEHIKATFFMVGKMARYHPEAARAVARAGMLIGDHTENHALLPGMTKAQIAHEIQQGQTSIRTVTGLTTHWFRSPYGAVTSATRQMARRFGMQTVAWDVDANDWKSPPAKAISSYVLGRVRPGSIVLLHDSGGHSRANTIAALPSIIKRLKKQGYRFVTLDQL